MTCRNTVLPTLPMESSTPVKAMPTPKKPGKHQITKQHCTHWFASLTQPCACAKHGSPVPRKTRFCRPSVGPKWAGSPHPSMTLGQLDGWHLHLSIPTLVHCRARSELPGSLAVLVVGLAARRHGLSVRLCGVMIITVQKELVIAVLNANLEAVPS